MQDTKGEPDLAESQALYIAKPLGGRSLKHLGLIDWDFTDAKTSYLTHSLHPYPAKFIPQIPNTLIQELSSVGDTVLDPFCGSGTTLVEAMVLKRHAVGLDANPIACLISKAKTLRLNESDVEALQSLDTPPSALSAQFSARQLSLFEPWGPSEQVTAPTSEAIQFWFDPHVINELAHIKALCNRLTTEAARTLAFAVFSSIIVSVSRQDSDTRYVRRAKRIAPGETVKRFHRALTTAIRGALEFTNLVEDRLLCRVVQADIMNPPSDIGSIDLVVCSPPYPNAYSYHLYHMTRMLWLDMDPFQFKKIEIGSHRKYSRKSPHGATISTFKHEMNVIFSWLRRTIRAQGYCCLVIGDSILKGVMVSNHAIITEAALANCFSLEADFLRRLQDTKKAFNPKIGNIRQEHILIFRNKC